MRVFAGYAGWGAEQLAGRDRGGQLVRRRRRGRPTPSAPTPSGLWRDVMRRQPGMLAWHVTRPVDPELN